MPAKTDVQAVEEAPTEPKSKKKASPAKKKAGAKKKKKKRKSRKKKKGSTALGGLCEIAAIIACALMSSFLTPVTIKENPALLGLYLAVCLIFSVGIGVYCFRRDKGDHSPLWIRILAASLFPLLFFPQLIFHKLAMILNILIILVPSILFPKVYKHIEKNRALPVILICAPFVAFLQLAFFAFSIEFFTPTTPFLLISLAIGLVIGIFVSAKWLWKDARFWGRVGWLLLTVLFAFMLVLIPLLTLNYALDFGETQTYTPTVVDKDYDFGAGKYRRSKYYLILDLDGQERKVKVTRLDYDQHEIGDTYPLDLHDGAFGVPFYLSSKYTK